VVKVNKEERKVGLSLKLKDEPRKEKSQPRRMKSEEPMIKPKSQLQIELEKHAARKKNDDDAAGE
jgi:hypothetical protein